MNCIDLIHWGYVIINEARSNSVNSLISINLLAPAKHVYVTEYTVLATDKPPSLEVSTAVG